MASKKPAFETGESLRMIYRRRIGELKEKLDEANKTYDYWYRRYANLAVSSLKFQDVKWKVHEAKLQIVEIEQEIERLEDLLDESMRTPKRKRNKNA